MFESSHLKRYPHFPRQNLQAYDAADELICSHYIESNQAKSSQQILVINDNFGAICKNISDIRPNDCVEAYTDSYVAAKAIANNNSHKITIFNDLDTLTKSYNTLLIRIPKNMSFFEDILCRVTSMANNQTQIIFTSMIKHLPKKAFELINQYIGVTTTSLAKKKARLIFANFEKKVVTSIYPLQIEFTQLDLTLSHHSNLFSRKKLDIGTRFFLQNIPQVNATNILDIGCANGIIGIMAKKLNPAAILTFTDDSFMAIKSTRENFTTIFPEQKANFIWTNCFEENDKEFIDLALCNPPFHQGTTIGDFIALQMFKDVKRSLTKGGTLTVIGNTHLAYHKRLKEIFGNSKRISQNKKFTIITSVK